MSEGSVKYWNSDRGFGFIARSGWPDIFVHVSQIQGGAAGLAEGQLVRFDERVSERNGKQEAINVRVVRAAPTQ